MAGYGTIFGPAMFDAFAGRILNTHPALLPSFKGWHAVRDALEAGVKVTGCTVHLAIHEVDAGPILAQEAVPVEPDDTEDDAPRADQGGRTADLRADGVGHRGKRDGAVKALLSVYDKSGVVELAAGLTELGWELLSSGGTAKAIAEAGLEVTDVADLTGVPAILGHRVVTLHPKVHGGLLADRNDPSHVADMEEYGIEGIDLVVVNLYPFSSDPSIELIDIGGPAMVRAAAKNHEFVGVRRRPGRLRRRPRHAAGRGRRCRTDRRRAAGPQGVRHDRGVRRRDRELARHATPTSPTTGRPSCPPSITLHLDRREVLRYGENPHQVGARYATRGELGWWESATQHGGKELSYLNVYDADAAWRLAWSLGDDPTAVVIKHANPCGAAIADDITTAYVRAHECDPTSAYGGIVAVNGTVTAGDGRGAQAGVHRGADRAGVRRPMRWCSCWRSATCASSRRPRRHRRCRACAPSTAGYLVQTPDLVSVDRSGVAGRHQGVADRGRSGPTSRWPVGWCQGDVERHRARARPPGGRHRLRPAEPAGRRPAGRARRPPVGPRAASYASDAFFPFADGLDGAVEAGATVVVEPGGSIRDEEVIAAADEHGLAMVFTGERHFRH